MRRRGSDWQPISWREAIETVAERLVAIRNQYGSDAVATYFGNPAYHGLENPVYGDAFLRSLGTKNRFTVASMDHFPRLAVNYWLYGHAYLFGLPDLGRTEHLLVLGANPLVSMGSLMCTPGLKGRLSQLRRRGGKLVVIDPRRSETADFADEHHFIRPETDPAFLLGMLNTMIEEELVDLAALPAYFAGLAEVVEWIEPFTAERDDVRAAGLRSPR
jgi:anaerobic selenocysteine-containing dehydrogenase